MASGRSRDDGEHRPARAPRQHASLTARPGTEMQFGVLADPARLAHALGKRVNAANPTDTLLAPRYRRPVHRRGKTKAIVAVGRSILAIVRRVPPTTRPGSPARGGLP